MTTSHLPPIFFLEEKRKQFSQDNQKICIGDHYIERSEFLTPLAAKASATAVKFFKDTNIGFFGEALFTSTSTLPTLVRTEVEQWQDSHRVTSEAIRFFEHSIPLFKEEYIINTFGDVDLLCKIAKCIVGKEFVFNHYTTFSDPQLEGLLRVAMHTDDDLSTKYCIHYWESYFNWLGMKGYNKTMLYLLQKTFPEPIQILNKMVRERGPFF